MNNKTNPHDAMNGAIYARSVVLNPASIKRQIDACSATAVRMSINVRAEHTYIDTGTSGNTLVGRAGLNALFEAAKANPPAFRWVLMEDESRIARNLATMADVIQRFHRLGVTVYFAQSGRDSRDKQFMTGTNLLSAFDRYFRESVKERRARTKALALQPPAHRRTDPPQRSLRRPWPRILGRLWTTPSKVA
jgi:DNA invertase Pin-like site-specific DNA recombinase